MRPLALFNLSGNLRVSPAGPPSLIASWLYSPAEGEAAERHETLSGSRTAVPNECNGIGLNLLIMRVLRSGRILFAGGRQAGGGGSAAVDLRSYEDEDSGAEMCRTIPRFISDKEVVVPAFGFCTSSWQRRGATATLRG